MVIGVFPTFPTYYYLLALIRKKGLPFTISKVASSRPVCYSIFNHFGGATGCIKVKWSKLNGSGG